MSEILSVAQPNNNDNLWCAGYAYRDNEKPSNRIAVVMKMDDDGDIKFVKQWGDSVGDSATLTSSITVDDVARAINFDEKRSEIVVLMEVHSERLRPDYSEESYNDNCFYQVKMSRGDLEDSRIYVEYDDDDTQAKTVDRYLFS